MALLIFYFIFVLTISFFCSLLESVILSVKDSFIGQLQSKGSTSGDVLHILRKDIDRPLAAILTLNTVSNTLGASLISATVMQLYGSEMVALISGILTFGILIFSEIIPKTVGALYWRVLAIPSAYVIKYLIVLLYPIVSFCEFVAYLTTFGKKRPPLFTRDELIATAEISQEEGSIKYQERNVIKNLLHLDKIYVKDVMTPRSVMVAFPADVSVGQIVKQYPSVPFSRIPIYKMGMDDIVGVVLRYELLENYAQSNTKKTLLEDGAFATSSVGSNKVIGAHKTLEDISHPIHKVLENQSIGTTLNEFLKYKEHIFIAIDQNEQTTGLITLEDALETLLGVEIMDEFDSVEDMRQFALEQSQKRHQKRRTSQTVRSIIQEISKMKES